MLSFFKLTFLKGYLSRALSSAPNNFNVLALDSNANQTAGSISRKDWLSQTNPETEGEAGEGTLTHMTTFIDDYSSLSNAIEEWIRMKSSHISKVPVVLVGLHCCGDLTPAILRFIQKMRNSHHDLYDLIGCVVVGCCYNLCSPSGMLCSSPVYTFSYKPTAFPLSRKVSCDISEIGPLSLETQHLHLATQSPRTWVMDTEQDHGLGIGPASMSIRKVVYRALLARRLPTAQRPDADVAAITDVDWRTKRVGRLANTAYKDFPTFLKVARGKLGLEAASTVPTSGPREGATSDVHQKLDKYKDLDLDSDLSAKEMDLSKPLEALYVLRCMLGPAIESLIALDRFHYLEEVLLDQSTSSAEDTHEVRLVNLFDQSTGSLRNLGLVWKLSGENGI
jgi:hypothetical protein